MLAGAAATTSACASGTRPATATAGRRDVEPHALVNRGRRWYLVCWDRGRDDWRTFRVDRIAEPVPLAVRFTPRPLPAEDPAAFVEQRFAALPSRYEARITLHAPAESVRVRRRGAR